MNPFFSIIVPCCDVEPRLQFAAELFFKCYFRLAGMSGK